MIYGQPITFGGKKAEGEISITNNGTFDVSEYATAKVDVHEAPVLLWTNASPSSEFAPQTVSLPSGYSAYLVEYNAEAGSQYKGVAFLPIGTTYYSVANAYPTYFVFGRRDVVASSSAITFGEGKLDSYSINNRYGIPLRIWGVKFTL